jgi:hypothetical protein
MSSTCQHTFPRTVCHVSPYGRATCHHCKGDTCHSLIGPSVPTASSICMPIHLPTSAVWTLPRKCKLCLPCQWYSSTTCTISYHVALYGLYSHHLFFCVWKNEQITISGAYDIHLSPFKLFWVLINETYAHVHFEPIMRIFIFRPL